MMGILLLLAWPITWLGGFGIGAWWTHREIHGKDCTCNPFKMRKNDALADRLKEALLRCKSVACDSSVSEIVDEALEDKRMP